MSADAVRDQYEAYPYPARDPADEAKRLITGSPSHIAEIDHYLFAGARDWTRPFRALFAGGGTGDGCIMLAQQLKDRGAPVEVAHLDLSAASQEVAGARARARGLDIRFVRGSLQDVAHLAPGPWDYIDCCGVLHHLPDPDAGLRALAAQLAPDGGMGLMVYGALGRTGVYPLQDALRALGADKPLGERVRQARTLLRDLPATNWFRRNALLADHQRGDAELVDLLLHSQDRAYTVPQIGSLCRGAGLGIVSFIAPLHYDPTVYLADPGLQQAARQLPAEAQWALAEILSGAMKTHIWYAAPLDRAPQAAARLNPAARPIPLQADAAATAKLLARETLVLDLDGHKARLATSPAMARMAALCDGRRTLGQMAQALGQDWFAFQTAFTPVWRILNGLNLLLLRR